MSASQPQMERNVIQWVGWHKVSTLVLLRQLGPKVFTTPRTKILLSSWFSETLLLKRVLAQTLIFKLIATENIFILRILNY